jgi:hypothetical protein
MSSVLDFLTRCRFHRTMSTWHRDPSSSQHHALTLTLREYAGGKQTASATTGVHSHDHAIGQRDLVTGRVRRDRSAKARKPQRVSGIGTRARNCFRVARNLSKIDAERGDHFPQADISLLIRPGMQRLRCFSSPTTAADCVKTSDYSGRKG